MYLFLPLEMERRVRTTVILMDTRTVFTASQLALLTEKDCTRTTPRSVQLSLWLHIAVVVETLYILPMLEPISVIRTTEGLRLLHHLELESLLLYLVSDPS